MLAVVEHQQKPALDQVFQERLPRRPLRIQDAKCGGDRLFDASVVGKWRQVHPPDTVAKIRTQLLRDPESQSRLSTPADSGERHESVGLELPGEFRQFVNTANEACPGYRKVARCVHGARRARALVLAGRSRRELHPDGLERGSGGAGMCIAFAGVLCE